MPELRTAFSQRLSAPGNNILSESMNRRRQRSQNIRSRCKLPTGTDSGVCQQKNGRILLFANNDTYSVRESLQSMFQVLNYSVFCREAIDDARNLFETTDVDITIVRHSIFESDFEDRCNTVMDFSESRLIVMADSLDELFRQYGHLELNANGYTAPNFNLKHYRDFLDLCLGKPTDPNNTVLIVSKDQLTSEEEKMKADGKTVFRARSNDEARALTSLRNFVIYPQFMLYGKDITERKILSPDHEANIARISRLSNEELDNVGIILSDIRREDLEEKLTEESHQVFWCQKSEEVIQIKNILARREIEIKKLLSGVLNPPESPEN